ncbi:MAG: ABC transporter substrate-binding protein [Actinomycetaceae bacterium]|nr:ABC transporter substrate-binding protein [Actinomycetaceae bacterium]
MKKKNLFLLPLAGILSFSLAACGAGAKDANNDKESTVVIKDQSNPVREVKAPHGAQRIATAIIPYPEVVTAVDDGSWNRIVGINKTTLALNKGSVAGDLYPESLNTTVITTDGFDVDPEVLAKLNADSAVQWHYEDMKHLQDAGLPTIGLNYGTLDDLKGWISITGQLLAKEDRASQIVKKFDDARSEINNKVKDKDKVSAITLVSVEDAAFSAFSADQSYDKENFDTTNATGVATGIPDSSGQITVEKLIEWNPDVIFISGLGKATPDDVLNHPLLKELSAVKNKRVYKTPTGIFPWQIPCAENYLMWYWMNAVLRPDDSGVNVREKAREEMKFLFNKELTDEQLDKVFRMDMNKGSANYEKLFGASASK